MVARPSRSILQAKLERLLCAFTLDVCDKIARHKLIDDDQGALDAVARQRRQEMDEELKKFKEAEFERLKQEDEWFARDHDVDAKKNETRRQLMAHSLAQVRPSPIYDYIEAPSRPRISVPIHRASRIIVLAGAAGGLPRGGRRRGRRGRRHGRGCGGL